MKRPSSLLLATVFIGLVCLGCNDEDVTGGNTDGQCEGCVDPLTSQPDTSSSTGGDDITSEPVTPIFQVGYNEAGQVDPTAFVAPANATDIPVVLGTQGSWMVVVAGMTNRLPCCVDRVDLTATVGVKDQVPLGKIKLKRRPVFRTANGDQYIMNIFLVVPPDPQDWDGLPVTLSLDITPHEGGETLSAETNVVLRQITPEALKPGA